MNINMVEDEIFKEIRRVAVTLWVGSGFSYYAGYKSGTELRDQIIQLLDPEAQRLYSSKSLQEISQIVQDNVVEGRHKILSILKEEFVDKRPSTTKYHEILAKIPHFNSIITTNYDRLLELAFGTRARCIVNDTELNSREAYNTLIYKVHGDVSDPNSIVISTSDYIHSISKQDSNIISVVKSQIATKTILFIGYDLNDSNINRIFEQVWSNVGHLNIPSYFVAPSLSTYRITSLGKFNIRYIDSKGEVFIERLYKNIGANIINDHKNGYVGSDVLRRFLANESIYPELTGNDEKYEISAIKGISESNKGSGILKLNATSEFLNQFTNFLSGRNLADFIIPNNIVENFTLSVGDITLMNVSDIALKLQTLPSYEGVIDIRFSQLGLEFKNYSYKLYKHDSYLEIAVYLKCGLLSIQNTNNDYSKGLHLKLTGKHHDRIGKTSDEIEYYQFSKALMYGYEFSFEIDGVIIKNKINRKTKNKDGLNAYLRYFENLLRIENRFNIRFDDYLFTDINDETDAIASYIVEVITNNEVERRVEEPIYATLDKSVNHNELYNLDGNTGLTAIQQHPTEYKLHGRVIKLGYLKARFPNLILKNYNDLRKGKTDRAKFISKFGKYYVSYLQNPE